MNCTVKITQEQLTESSVSKSSRVTTVILSGVERKMHLPEMSVRGRFSGNKSGTAEHSALSLKSRDEALFLYTGREVKCNSVIGRSKVIRTADGVL